MIDPGPEPSYPQGSIGGGQEEPPPAQVAMVPFPQALELEEKDGGGRFKVQRIEDSKLPNSLLELMFLQSL